MMHSESRTHTTQTNYPIVAFIASLALLTCAGCGRTHSDADGHDHDQATSGKAAGAPADPHGHAHAPGEDHDHAGEGEHADEVTLTPEAIARYHVRAEAVTRRVLKSTVTAPARAAFNGDAIAHVGAPLRGWAVEINVRQGDVVTVGQPLLVVESPELGDAQVELLHARATAEAAAPSVALAKATWDRARTLHEQSQSLSLTEVQRREAEYIAASNVQKAAETDALSAERRLLVLGMDRRGIDAVIATGAVSPRFTIHAPIAGRVIQREVTLGEIVSPDRDALMVLADTRTLWLIADVSEARLHEVAEQARAWVTPGAPGAPRVEGRVTLVAPSVDPSTRTVQVRIELSETPDSAGSPPLRPGMFALVEIEASDADGGEPKPVLAVPAGAVHTVEGGPAVFVPVKGEPGTFAMRPVQIGPAVGGFVPLRSGISEGEQVVVSGAFILKAELGKSGAAHEH